MEYISSDTNVWFDFVIIGKIELPFMLPYKYIMNEGTIGILDQLHSGNYIAKSEYLSCLEALLKENGKKVRLPKSALLERLHNE